MSLYGFDMWPCNVNYKSCVFYWVNGNGFNGIKQDTINVNDIFGVTEKYGAQILFVAGSI